MIQKDDVVRLRTRLGLTQEKFAEKLGVSVSAVATNKHIKGKRWGLPYPVNPIVYP